MCHGRNCRFLSRSGGVRGTNDGHPESEAFWLGSADERGKGSLCAAWPWSGISARPRGGRRGRGLRQGHPRCRSGRASLCDARFNLSELVFPNRLSKRLLRDCWPCKRKWRPFLDRLAGLLSVGQRRLKGIFRPHATCFAAAVLRLLASIEPRSTNAFVQNMLS